MVINLLEILGVIFGMAVLSFSFKPNPIHRIVESLFIGASAGYLLVTNFNRAYTSGIAPIPKDPLLIIPLILGVLMYFRLSKKIAWLSNYPLAFLTSIGIGISIRTIVETDILKQIKSTALPLIVSNSAIETFSNLVIGVSVPTVITYFFYTREHKGVLGISSKAGMAFMMIAFGTAIANSFLSRVSKTITLIQKLLLVPSGLYIIPLMVIIIAISAFPEKIGLRK